MRPARTLVLLALLACTGEDGADDKADSDTDTDLAAETDAPDTEVSADTDPLGEASVLQAPWFDSDVFRQYPGIAELDDGRVLITGGQIVRSLPEGGPGRSTGREETELLDPAAQTFVEVSPLNEGRWVLRADTLPDGRVLATGGTGGPPGEQGMRRRTAEIFDPATSDWTLVDDLMVEPRTGHHSMWLTAGPHAGQLLLLGGAETWSAERYDPSLGTFHPVPLTDVPPSYTLTYTVLSDGLVLLTGVEVEADTPQACFLFDPATGVFTRTGDLSQPNGGYTVTALADGGALLTGGSDGVYVYFDQAERWDPGTGEWTVLSDTLRVPRRVHASARLASGRVVIAGGAVPDGDQVIGSCEVEIFDPATDTFELADGSLGACRALASAFPLADGRVMVVGGQAILPRGNTAILSTVDFISD